LLDAGVPLKRPVAGISVGLVTEFDANEKMSRYLTMLDIIGSEDHFGDMDFKLCGTDLGVTGFQLDLKLPGIPLSLLNEAIAKAKIGRTDILAVMNGIINGVKPLSQYAPRIEKTKINPDKIGELIGPGGKNIKAIQAESGADPSEILIHLRMLDKENVRQQEALGIIGVNLIHGTFYSWQQPEFLIRSLLDDLTWERAEVDMIRFAGPAFAGVDNRLMALELVRKGLTEAAMFTAEGEAVQWAEVLYKKPVLVQRGSFRPLTKATLDVLEKSGGEGIILSVGGGTSPGMPKRNIVAMLEALEQFNGKRLAQV